MNYTMADFLAADISVTEIDNIWYGQTAHWQRNAAPREMEGLLFFFSGGNHYNFGDFSFDARAGQIVRLPAGIPYGGDSITDERLQFICIDFYTARPGDFLHFPMPFAYTPADADSVVRQMRALHEKWHAHALCGKLACKAELMQLLARLAAEYAAAALHCDNRCRILRITEFIRQNAPRHDFRMAEAAEHFFLSEAQLRRVFAAELGMSPSAYLTETRMELAKSLLSDPRELSVREIAEACGYTSVYYFSAVFREQIGCSPSEHRKKSRLLL